MADADDIASRVFQGAGAGYEYEHCESVGKQMNAIKTSGRFVIVKKRLSLRWCLLALEVEMPPTEITQLKRQQIKWGIRGGRIETWPMSLLWQLYETAKRNFRRLMWKTHPDHGGDARKCGRITCCWRYIQRRMAVLGVGT